MTWGGWGADVIVIGVLLLAFLGGFFACWVIWKRRIRSFEARAIENQRLLAKLNRKRDILGRYAR